MECTRKLRLMQFNIRQGEADKGPETAWDQQHMKKHNFFLPWSSTSIQKPRQDAVVACIVEHSPDIVATQEGLEWQIRDMETLLLGKYAWVGRGRGTKWCPDETSAILYIKDQWVVEHSGDFMHSSTPNVWGSSYRWASWPMITTWVVLRGIGSRAGERVLALSTHLEPLNARVRAMSAEQVLAEAARLRVEHQCHDSFLLGDFNCDCGEAPFRRCIEEGWVDMVSSVEGPYQPGSFTFHAFQGPAFHPTGWLVSYFDKAIDFIWSWPNRTKDAMVTTDKRRFSPAGPDDVNGVYPSDHYPVIVDVSMGMMDNSSNQK